MLVHVLFILWILGNNAFEDYYKQSWLMSIELAKSMGGGINLLKICGSLFPLLNIGLVIDLWIWLIVPINALAVLFIILYKNQHKILSSGRISSEFTAVIVIGITGLASWLQYYPVTYFRHVYWAATPMLGLLMYSI